MIVSPCLDRRCLHYQDQETVIASPFTIHRDVLVVRQEHGVCLHLNIIIELVRLIFLFIVYTVYHD